MWIEEEKGAKESLKCETAKSTEFLKGSVRSTFVGLIRKVCIGLNASKYDDGIQAEREERKRKEKIGVNRKLNSKRSRVNAAVFELGESKAERE